MQQILLNNSEPIQVEAIVRTVPHQRIVVRGEWNGQAVYAKVFYGRRAKQHYLRDLAGINYLEAASISTPRLLHKDESYVDGECAFVLIFAAIIDSVNAEQLLSVSIQHDRFDLVVKLVKAVAVHHQANLVQTDLYPKNFLVTSRDIYTIDGDGIRRYVKLDQKLALNNLALLLSKFDVLDVESWIERLLLIYKQVRGLNALPNRESVLKLTYYYRQKITSNYADKKVFRQCTDVNVYQNRNSFIAKSSGFENLHIPSEIKLLEVLVDNALLLKNGNTCTVVLAKFDDSYVVIKRYNIKNVNHGLSRTFRKTRASISWGNAYRLKAFGIQTPEPIALIEQRGFPVKGKAYFLSEYIKAPDVANFFLDVKESEVRDESFKEIAKLFYRLYLLKLSHGDMKSTNVLMFDKRPMLIDLDSMKQHRYQYFALKSHIKDLRRFMQNWKDNTSLYNAFVDAFKGIYIDKTPLIKAKILND